jgi:gamma-glutamylcyclotransferase (GGCT)/AIG2-like uncharacterized protein YtfP
MSRRKNSQAVNGRAKRSPNSYLFVYGTLMKGQRLHHHLGDPSAARYVGPAKIRGELYRLPARRYPAAIQSLSADHFVHGELYRMRKPAHVLPALDEVEGCNEGLFERRLVNVWAKGTKRRAWTYLFAQPLPKVPKAQIIPTGRFHYQQAHA